MSFVTLAARAQRRAALAVVACTVAGAPAALRAQTDYYNTDRGRPITVEDAYPVERRALELQVAPLRLARTQGGAYTWGLEPTIAAGVLPRTQLELGLPLAWMDRGVAGHAVGPAGVELSALHNLNAETAIPALALAVDLLLPAGAFGPAQPLTTLTALATRTLPWARFHANAGYTVGADDAGGVTDAARWQLGVAADRTLPLRSLLVTGEVVARRPLLGGESMEWSTGGGARWQLSPRVAADGGAGYRLTGRDVGWYATFGAAVAVGLPWRAR